MPDSFSITAAKLEPDHLIPEPSTIAVRMRQGSYARGTILGIVTVGGLYAAYSNAASDGTQTAAAIAMYDMQVAATGIITFSDDSEATGGDHRETHLTAPVYVAGVFRTTDLVGLDAAAVAELGRIIRGSLANGLLQVG